VTDKLEACPFCGGEDAFVEQSTFASSYAICNDCMARGPDSTQESDEENEPGRDAAIAAWNTRTAPHAPEGWQPIETAPRDGTEFQSWCQPDDGANGRGGWWEPRCRFHPEYGGFEIWGRVDYDHDDWDNYAVLPRFWMPHPAAPASPQVGEG
jgi:Lar family restriction alleviation protein